MPAYCRSAAYDAFLQALPDIETTQGLFRAAFAIARHELPDANVTRAEATISDLADTVNRRVYSSHTDARLAHLHDVLFDVVGFTGNAEDYYNPSNSYLPEVLRTLRGLPITLALIYKCVAERVGLTVCGINSPGHFLVGVKAGDRRTVFGIEPECESEWMYIDPFHGGQVLRFSDVARRIVETTGRPPDDVVQWLTPTTHRQWIIRMLNNLQAIFARSGRERDLYAMLELHEILTQ